MKSRIQGMLLAAAALILSVDMTAFAMHTVKAGQTENVKTENKWEEDILSASTITASGECGIEGDNLTWELTDEGLLTISGVGDMEDYYSPWDNMDIKKVIINEGVTSIGVEAFLDQDSLTEITIAKSVTSATRPFEYCSNLVKVIFEEGMTAIPNRILYGVDSPELEVVMPNSVTSIGDEAFSDCSGIKEIELPDNLTRIGEWAFQNCNGLTEIVIPKNVTGAYESFKSCSNLSKVIFEEGMITIPGRILSEVSSSKVEVVIPNTVTTIEYEAFYDCDGLAEITIPKSVTRAYSIFAKCSNLTKIIFEEGMTVIPEYIMESEDSTEVEVVIPNTVTTIEVCAFSGCDSLKEITIPNSVTKAHESFSGCSNLAKVIFEEGMTTIPDYILSEVDSTEMEVVIPKTVTSIGKYAFYNCDGLKEITIPKSVISTDRAFENCSNLAKVIFEEGMTTIPDYMLYDVDSPEVEVMIPDSVTSIGDSAFYNCEGLKEIQLPAGLTNIGNSAFSNCSNLSEIQLPVGVLNIGNSAFFKCGNLSEMQLPVSLTSIGDLAFANCNGLSEIKLPVSLTSIGNLAFSNCSGLSEIALPQSLTKLGYKAFSGCDGLTEIKIPLSVTTAGFESNGYYDDNNEYIYVYAGPFNGCKNLQKVIFEDGTTKIPNYMLAGADSANLEVVIPESVTSIGSNVFANCSSVSELELPSGVTSIDYRAFSDCTSLVEIILPTGVELSGNAYSVFQGCTSLIKADISGITNTCIPRSAFKGCTALTEVVLPEGIEEIREEAFYNCDSLESIDLPESITIIGNSVFRDCDSLKNITLPDNDTTIGSHVFYDCDNLTKVIIPDSVSSLGQHCFYHCDSLKEVTLGKGLTTLPSYAFAYCADLECIEIPYYTHTIENGVFMGCGSLTSITLPRKLTSMKDDVFTNTSDVTIYGIAGTYAETYANEHSIPFINREIKVQSLTFGESEIILGIDGEKQLRVSAEPENHTDELVLSSEDTSIATISENGVLKGVAPGTTTIQVSTDSVSASVRVTVVKWVDSLYVYGVSSLEAGEKSQFTVSVSPSDATNQTVVWESSDETIATVDKEGMVTALAAGTVEIIARATDGSDVAGRSSLTVKSPVMARTKEDLQSSHPYENSFSGSWIYKAPGKDRILLSFSDETYLEDNCDYIEIFDGTGQSVGRYTGNQLAGTTVMISSDMVKIKLTTDSSVSYFGFSVEKLESFINNDDDKEEIPEDSPGEVREDDLPEGGVEAIPEGLWIAGIEETGYEYTGKAIKPEVRVYHHKKLLIEKTDYTISYQKNIQASESAMVVVKGKENYIGKAICNFKITPLNINEDGFALDHMAAGYKKGKVQKPVPVLLWNGKKLKNNKDFSVTYPDMQSGAYSEPGTYTICVKGEKNYIGTREINLDITEEKLISKVSIDGLTAQSYTGEELQPGILVKDGSKILAEGKDYSLSYENNVEVGTGYIILTGMEGYHGQKRISFKIMGQSLKGARVSGLETVTYNGEEQKPVVTLQAKRNGEYQTLTQGEDYTVTYINNINVGKATVIFDGIGNYTGQVKKAFKINKSNLKNELEETKKLLVETNISVPYTKSGSKPKPAIIFNGNLLKENKDYTLSYKNNKTVNDESGRSTPSVIVKGKGNFTGSISVEFKITKAELENLTMEVADKVYAEKVNGAVSKPKIVDTDGTVLKANTDYLGALKYSYVNDTLLVNGTERKAGEEMKNTDIVPAGTVIAVTAQGTGNYEGTLRGEYRILKDASKDIKKAKVDKIADQIYTGKAITLTENDIKVKIGNRYLENGEFEIVKGSYKNNVKKGKASVIIRGLGEYGGTKTVTFTIKAKTFEWWKGIALETLFHR